MKKRFFVIFISVLLAVTLLTAFCAYAKPPIRSQLYGVVYGSSGSSAYYNLDISPINNNIFMLSSSTVYANCTLVNFFFKADVSGFTSFHLRLRRLSTEFSDASTSLSSVGIALRSVDSYGNISGNTSIRNNVTATKTVINGLTEYDWLYSVSTPIGTQNVLSVTIPFQSFVFGNNTVMYYELLDFTVNGEPTALTYTDQKLDEMLNYDSEGGSSDVEGASDMVSGIADDVNDITSTINSHVPAVSNWLSTSYVADDLMNIALLANSWLPAYLNCDPDVAFYWSLVTFCIVLCLIENGLRRRPWHGFSEGDDFESEYDVTSTDEKGRSRTIHNKVRGTRRRSK